MQGLKVIVAENTDMVVAGAASLKIIMLSMYSEEQYAIRSLRNGASASLTKANATDELIKDREAAASGKRYITPSVAERLASYIEEDGSRLPHERLSDRELQVFVMIGSGKSMSEIAIDLSLSIKTVSTMSVIHALESTIYSTFVASIKAARKPTLLLKRRLPRR